MTHKHIYDDHKLCFECDKGKPPINEAQFNLLATKLIKSTTQREAVKLHMLDGLSAYEAEKVAHGRVTANVSRDAKRITELYEFSRSLFDLRL